MARTIINASPTSTFTARTYVATNMEGVVESVEDVVSLISPYETPFYSSLRKESAKDILHYWLEDDLAAAVRTNAKPQGYEPTAASGASFDGGQPGMKVNACQIFTKTARVSGTGRAVQAYGRGDELDYQKMKRGRELRRDIEASLLGNVGATAPAAGAPDSGFPYAQTGSGTAGVLASAGHLIASGNQSVGGGAGAVTGTAGSIASPIVVTAGTARDLTETLVLAAQKLAYDQGGNPGVALVSPFHAQRFSNFAYIDPTSGSATTQRIRELAGDSQSVINNVVDVYKSPYGTLAVVQDRFQYGYLSGETYGSVLLLEMDRWHLAQLREMQSIDLAKTGDNSSALMLAELTLVHEHSKSSAIIRDLNIS